MIGFVSESSILNYSNQPYGSSLSGLMTYYKGIACG